MFKQRESRQSVNAMVGGLGCLKPPVPAEVLCRALCDAMGRRRGRKTEFRSTSLPPGTVGGEGPVLLEEIGTAARRHRAEERAAERHGLELAHAVRHLPTASDVPEPDRATRSGRYGTLCAALAVVFAQAEAPVEQLPGPGTYYADTPYTREVIVLHLVGHTAASAVMASMRRRRLRHVHTRQRAAACGPGAGKATR
ncbi:hypothetical protein [Streptomyces sp. NPDC001389]|uniref:hypothetical protein n=1 Tax=Streptomyces sp. NPDC001389 TaxID=3364569 RepID=UPI0036A2CD5B